MKNSKTSNPSQEEQPHNKPQQGQQRTEQPKEGDIRKVKHSDEPSAFDDDFETKQEEDVRKKEADTEEENNTSVNRNGDTFNKRSR